MTNTETTNTTTNTYNAKIGLIGLGPMGLNLAKNISSKLDSPPLYIYNRSSTQFNLLPNKTFKTTDLPEFIKEMNGGLIILLIPDKAIISMLNTLKSIIIENNFQNKFIVADAGNTNFKISRDHHKSYNDVFGYVCIGTSGGALGALNGPAMMVGCSNNEKPHLLNILKYITPYAVHVGECYMAHYVKMVHNGIEYGIMSIISEFTNFLVNMLGIDRAISFWTQVDKQMNSYLLKAVLKVLRKKNQKGEHVVFEIGNEMKQKGTGGWCLKESVDLGVGMRFIGSSVFQRSNKSNGRYSRVPPKHDDFYDSDESTDSDLLWNFDDLERCFTFLVYVSHYEGLRLLEEQYKHSDSQFKFSLSVLQNAWRRNCIIESNIMKTLKMSDAESLEVDILNFVYINYTAYLEFNKIDNMNISKEEFIEQIYKSFKKIGNNIIGFTSESFFAGFSYLTSQRSEDITGRCVMGMRDVFGQHGVEVDGGVVSLEWDEGNGDEKKEIGE